VKEKLGKGGEVFEEEGKEKLPLIEAKEKLNPISRKSGRD